MYKNYDDESVENLEFSYYFLSFSFFIFSSICFIGSLLLLYHFKLFDGQHFVGNLVVAFSCIMFLLSFIAVSCIFSRFIKSLLLKRKNRKIAIDNALKDVDYIKSKVDRLSVQSETSVLVDAFTNILSKQKNIF